MPSYKTALEEYESENNKGRKKLMYAHFGLAVFYTQCLEETFSLMLCSERIAKKKSINKQEVNEIIESIESAKKTMGKFIHDVKDCYNLPEQLVIDLKQILEKRNYIIHKFFKIEIRKTFSDSGIKDIIKYFCDFKDEVKRIDNELMKYNDIHQKKLGVTDQEINEMAKKMRQGLA